ncbi:RagB/SusD family nutrient uptake outer membrane protein [Pedobacter frigiditerrae]|uniref:RagB/SusD family nutrient uptake outer membrane protein n=1 Tax=Pedobacter frigiditerrae TaxID=2530452 RepID=A0A4R0MMK5_9SPHI|nr:RagB/SusD family nutrient uptake outer membrane protein [Pedobacter frigiditerrae]TCC87969.1 RagB/SusD family nutrient uptake outer membrane protein [Pedobacter frigiditerrae]
MKAYIKPLYITLCATLALTSCEKNFLEVEPTDRISTTSVESDTTIFEAYVLNRYIGPRLQEKESEGSNPGFGRGFEYSMMSSYTDESIYNNDDGSWLIQRGQISPDNLGSTGSFWSRSYRGIRECNYALSVLSKITMSAGHKKMIEGELKFIRAYRYHDIIRNYGRAVLIGDKVTQLSDNLQDPALFKRATLQESMNYAIAQLDEAAAALPANNTGTWQLGRATKGAALALKSRLALYAASPLYNAGTWIAATSAAQAVISLNKYGIYTGGYNKMFLVNETNEVIFERLFTTNARHVCLEIANGPNGYGGWGGNTPLQNLVDDYQMVSGKPITDPTSGYLASQPYANRDPRFGYTVIYNGAPYRTRSLEAFIPGGKDSKDGDSNWNTTKTGYYLKKFMNDSYPIDNPWDVAGMQPWIYMRYAEVLLNFAEAANEAYGPDVIPAGSAMSARQAINLVRARPDVNMPALAAGISQAEMRDAVKYERRVELAFEEHRYYDVRRWKIADIVENKPAAGIIVTKSGSNFTYAAKSALDGKLFTAKQYWLPIPRAEILASGNKLEQNADY